MTEILDILVTDDKEYILGSTNKGELYIWLFNDLLV